MKRILPRIHFLKLVIRQRKKNEQSKSLEKIIVDIKGNVVKPGIYEMDHDARVHEAIDLAGGFNEKAEQTAINLAQKKYKMKW